MKPDLSYRTDEALLFGLRLGNLTAENDLNQRYFDRKDVLVSRSSSCSNLLASWERNYCFFKAYTECLMTYRFGHNKFLTFFMVVLHNTLIQYATKNNQFRRFCISLDDTYGTSNELTLNDVVASPNQLDDPKYYLEYLYEANRLGQTIGGMTPIAVLVNSMKLNGMSLQEIAETTGLSYRQTRAHYDRFRKIYYQYVRGSPVPAK